MDEKEIRDVIDIASMKQCNKETILDALESVTAKLDKLKDDRNTIKKKLADIQEKLSHRETMDDMQIEAWGEQELASKEELNACEEEAALYLIFSNDLQKFLYDFKNFNKKRCIENIKALIKDNADAKIGQIEKEAGVSIGYMSRLDKPDNNTDLSIEFIVTAAKALNVSVDYLIFGSAGETSEDEKYLMDFFDDLLRDTSDGDIRWRKESHAPFEKPVNIWNGPNYEHPLLSTDESNVDSDGTPYMMRFISQFYPDSPIVVEDGIYSASVPYTESTLYIVPCSVSADETLGNKKFYEIYMTDEKGLSNGLCNTLQLKGQALSKAEELYKMAVADASKVHLDASVRSVIEKYRGSRSFMNIPDGIDG